MAFAMAGVGQVLVRLDDGAWEQAELLDPISARAWSVWRLPVARRQGRLTVMAIDRQGQRQAAEVTGAYPAGATGLHTVTFG